MGDSGREMAVGPSNESAQGRALSVKSFTGSIPTGPLLFPCGWTPGKQNAGRLPRRRMSHGAEQAEGERNDVEHERQRNENRADDAADAASVYHTPLVERIAVLVQGCHRL